MARMICQKIGPSDGLIALNWTGIQMHLSTGIFVAYTASLRHSNTSDLNRISVDSFVLDGDLMEIWRSVIGQ